MVAGPVIFPGAIPVQCSPVSGIWPGLRACK